MAWNLWESSYDQDAQEGSDFVQSGGKCDFFGWGQDVIEENALNEKFCIQVLRIQITKADTEIDELEQNLVSLQTELACFEDEEWPEICSKALRDKIAGLEISIRRLRNKSENVTELQLLMPREPAEKIEDILKALIKKHLQEKDKQQPPRVIDMGLKSDGSADAVELSTSIEWTHLESDVNVKEESGETNTPDGRCARTNSSSTLQEKKINCSKEIKVINEQPVQTNTTDPSPDCLRLAAGSADEEKKLIRTKSGRIARQLETTVQEPNSKDEKMIENESLNNEGERNVEVSQTAQAIFEAFSSGSIKFSNECIGVVKSLCISDLKMNRILEVDVGVRKEHPTATDNLLPERDQALDEMASKAIVEYISPEAFIQSATMNARNRSSESNLSTSKHYDMEEKLVEVLKRPIRHEGIGESKIGKITINLEQTGEPEVESQKAIVALDKSDLNSLQKKQILIAKRKFQTNLQRNIQAEPGAAFDKSHLGPQPQSMRTKRKPQPDSQSTDEQGFPPTKRKCNASSRSIYKTQKLDSDDDNTSLKQLVFGKNTKKLIPLNPSAKVHGTLAMAAEHPLPQPPGGKRIPNLPLSALTEEFTVDLKFSDTPTQGSNGGSVGNNPNGWQWVPMDSSTRTLSELKLPELKALAKQNKVTSYSKLKKNALIEILAEKLGSQIQR